MVPAAPSTATTVETAGWWTRASAFLIDALALTIVGGIVTLALYGDDLGASFGLQVLIACFYFGYFWSAYGNGQTLGMRTLDIKVVRTGGSYLDLWGSFLRGLGLVLSIACFLIGVIWAAFDDRGQGWHDKLAGTHVVKV